MDRAKATWAKKAFGLPAFAGTPKAFRLLSAALGPQQADLIVEET